MKRTIISAALVFLIGTTGALAVASPAAAADYWDKGGYSTLAACQADVAAYRAAGYRITKLCYHKTAPATGWAFGYYG